MEDPEILAKIEVFQRKVLDGHAPGLTGKDLCAYIVGRAPTTSARRWKKPAKNSKRYAHHDTGGLCGQEPWRLLPLVNEHNSRNCFFVTDDLDPEDILEKGHINNLVRTAINKGLDPIRAIQMATINPASYFRLRELGRVAPGLPADLLILDDLKQVSISRVYQSGRLVAEAGKLVVPSVSTRDAQLPDSMNVAWDKVKDFSIKSEGNAVNIIQVVPGQIVTKRLVEPAPIADGLVVADPARDILKIAVIERHHGTGAFALALIRGFGLKTRGHCMHGGPRFAQYHRGGHQRLGHAGRGTRNGSNEGRPDRCGRRANVGRSASAHCRAHVGQAGSGGSWCTGECGSRGPRIRVSVGESICHSVFYGSHAHT